MGRIMGRLLPIVIGTVARPVARPFVLPIRNADPQPVQQLRQAVSESCHRAAPRAYRETGVRTLGADRRDRRP